MGNNIAFFVLCMLFLVGCAQKISEIEENTKPIEVTKQPEQPKEPSQAEQQVEGETTPPSQGLGRLCSNEGGCKEFCSNNRGLCESYCRENKNELCAVIFPPENEVNVVASNDVKFTHEIFDLEIVSHITPLGELNGGYEEAQAVAGIMINLKQEAIAGGKEIEIRAPTDMTLENYAYYRSPNDGQLGWTLIFHISPEVRIKFDHITRVTQEIVDATNTVPADTSAEQYPKHTVSVKAGDIFAYTSGTPTAHNWNIYLTDTRQKNGFINSKRYASYHAGQKMLTAKCPFDFYPDEMKSEFLALMGYSRAGQSQTCGSVSRDVVGTISGMWHSSPTYLTDRSEQLDGVYASPLSIIKNSAGEITIDQVNNMRLEIKPESVAFKDPAEVTGEHCYQLKNGYVYFKIIDDMTMDFYYSDKGNCPSSFPPGGKRYYR